MENRSPQSANDPSVPRTRPLGLAWALLALLTCPCHLPVVAFLLAGTTAGAFIGDHMALATLSAAVLFGLSCLLAFRAMKKNR